MRTDTRGRREDRLDSTPVRSSGAGEDRFGEGVRAVEIEGRAEKDHARLSGCFAQTLHVADRELERAQLLEAPPVPWRDVLLGPESLELDGVGAGLGGEPDELLGQCDAALVVVADLGDDHDPLETVVEVYGADLHLSAPGVLPIINGGESAGRTRPTSR